MRLLHHIHEVPINLSIYFSSIGTLWKMYNISYTNTFMYIKINYKKHKKTIDISILM